MTNLGFLTPNKERVLFVTFICEVILFSRVIKSSKIKNIEIILKKRNT